jgi:uncharacterized protein (DUF2249 family)
MTPHIITLDVREEFRSGQSPCDKVHGALQQVGPNETLRLLVPFEPVPLFQVAGKLGLTHVAKAQAGGDWEVLFSRDANAADRPAGAPMPTCECGSHEPAASVVEVDARGLQPPQPMVKILEALEQVPAGAQLDARTDRRPVHLYGFLEDRGFTGESEEQSDGSFLTHIRRR